MIVLRRFESYSLRQEFKGEIMEILGLNELQWLTLVICSGGLFYSIGKQIGMSNTLEYMRKEGYIDYDD